jgi:hypothetical protein
VTPSKHSVASIAAGYRRPPTPQSPINPNCHHAAGISKWFLSRLFDFNDHPALHLVTTALPLALSACLDAVLPERFLAFLALPFAKANGPHGASPGDERLARRLARDGHEKQSPRYSGLIGGSAIPIPNTLRSRHRGLSFSDGCHKNSLLALQKKPGAADN